jgi:hypothetical protein
MKFVREPVNLRCDFLRLGLYPPDVAMETERLFDLLSQLLQLD